MRIRHGVLLVGTLFIAFMLMSCGVFGSDGGSSGLKIEYEARHLSYADRWEWQPGEDSMRVDVSVDGELVSKEVVGSPTLSGSVQVSGDRGETALVSAFILTENDSWNAELEVSWGNQRETEQGYASPSAGLAPSIPVPLNEDSSE
ncbi:hypothetical protein [Salinibacter sp.]|uniref:hypothetical protein n=1 Tax=Salinibacter sp. TaxID=2065818 RepID=UPI0021E934DF|nr:hypothetical protein [Salinibacter sp.]